MSAATVWSASASLSVGDIIAPTSASSGLFFRVTQAGTTVTITISSHGVAVGDELTIDYTTGSAPDGTFLVASVTDSNVFTVTAAASATNSGNVSITLSGAGQYVCENWNKSIPYNNRATIQATFREVFEP